VETLAALVFDGVADDYRAWGDSPPVAARLVWEAKTLRLKLSDVAEAFFRLLAQRQGAPMLLKKGELHRLVPHALLGTAAEAEVRAKLDLLAELFEHSRPQEEQAVVEPADDNGAADKDA
jgi:hypothetical protein